MLNGRNVFCQLPTGFGKSLPMFVYPMIRKGGTESISEIKARPFRDAFGKLGVLRLLATASNSFLVMTATVTADTRAKILSKLNFKRRTVALFGIRFGIIHVFIRHAITERRRRPTGQLERTDPEPWSKTRSQLEANPNDAYPVNYWKIPTLATISTRVNASLRLVYAGFDG